jgi:chitin disaccharide deacetylase
MANGANNGRSTIQPRPLERVPITCWVMTSLVERLGYPMHSKLVILSCDDLGSCHAANMAVYEALRDGAATCTSLMVPAPWARHAAQMYKGEDIGVHLTLNAENEFYRWGPITHAPSLLSGEGGFPRTIDDLWEHADPEEVRRECRAQIERTMAWGIDVTHLAPHLTAITLRPEFFDIYIDLACEFRLPIRLPSSITEQQAGFPFRKLAAEEGIVFPDAFNHTWKAPSRDRILAELAELPEGVTEIHVQPALDTAEVRALSNDAEGWIDDYNLVVHDPALRHAITTSGAVLIGYRDLRDAMRA